MPTLPEEMLYSNITRIVGAGEDYAVDAVSEFGKSALVVTQNVVKTSIINATITINNTPTELKVGISRLLDRRSILIQPQGVIYIGGSSVDYQGANKGICITYDQLFQMNIADIPLYAVSEGSVEVSIMEVA